MKITVTKPEPIRKKVTVEQFIRLQVYIWSEINKTPLTELESECLCVLISNPGKDLSVLCKLVLTAKNSQSARNAFGKLEQKGIIGKSGKNKKKVWLNPEIKIYPSALVLLTYEFLSINDTGKIEDSNKGDSTGDGDK